MPKAIPPLKFKVAPHIVEDLGLNLYTSLPRVLVEFVANAYDADAEYAEITLNSEEIRAARETLKAQYKLEQNSKKSSVQPLATRTLPEALRTTIEDNGIGMSRQELDEKFLVAGRRRRIEEKSSGGKTK